MTVKYTPQYEWLKAEFKKVDREKTPWLIVIMHSPMYNSNSAHYMEGESMRVAYESWFVENKVDIVIAGHVHAYERSVCHSSSFISSFLIHDYFKTIAYFTRSMSIMIKSRYRKLRHFR